MEVKKVKRKKSQTTGKTLCLEDRNIEGEMEQTGKNIEKQLCIRQEIELIEAEEKRDIVQKKATAIQDKIGQLPEQARYNKLKTESKHLQNIIKIICYRAETSISNLLAPHYQRSSDEIRALVKSIIFTKADLYPDYQTNTLTVRLE